MTDINQQAQEELESITAPELTAEQIESEAEEAAFQAALAGDEPATEAEETTEILPEQQPEATDPSDAIVAAVLEKLNPRIRNVEGHIGSLNGTMKQMREAAMAASAAASNKGADAPTGAQISAAMKSSEKLEALRQDFPEFAEVFDEIRGQAPSINVDEIRQAAVSEATTQAKQIIEQELLAMNEDILNDQMPDWQQVAGSQEFLSWMSQQTPDIQALYTSPRARDAIKALSLYKEQTASPTDLTASSRQQQRLASAVTPTRGGKAPLRSPPMTEEEAFRAAFNS